MWQEAATTEELSTQPILCKKIGDKQILITSSGGTLYRCGAICPHQGVNMKDGLVYDDEITCTEHSWVFSLKTGELTWPGSGPRIPIYPVRIVGDVIEVLIQESAD